MPSMDQLRSASVLPGFEFEKPGVPLLQDNDLNNSGRFIKIPHVPLIDVHDDDFKGNIDLKLLKLIAKNSNDRVEKGEPIVVTVGHMKRKNTIIVVRPDGGKIILPGTDENQQPPIIGYAKNLTIDKFRDNDWLHGDFYIKNENAKDPIENPFRSVERVVPPDDGEDDGDDSTRHYIDRISLLRTPPEREGGVIHYDREDCIVGCCGTGRRLLRLCYSRDTEPMKGKTMPMEEEGPGGGAAVSDEPQPPMEEEEGGGGLPATMGEMSPQDFFEGMAHVIRLVLDEKSGGGEAEGQPAPPPGGEEEEHVPYEKDLSKNAREEMDIARRVPYSNGTAGGGMSQAGGSNTNIPGSKTVKGTDTVKKGRVKYERETRGDPALPTKPPYSQVNIKDAITRVQYAKDKGEVDEILTYLYSQLSDMQLSGRRVVYKQTLHGLRDMEGVDLSDEDIDALVNQVTDKTPENHEPDKITEIRKYYGRRAVNVPQIPVGLPPFASAGAVSHRPATADEVRHATALRMEAAKSGKELSYADAMAQVRGK